jgi:hypothetical protein
MARIAIIFGILLCCLTLAALLSEGGPATVPSNANAPEANANAPEANASAAEIAKPSPTRFIPLAAGVPLFICGIIALNPLWRKHAMHIAAMIGLLGTLACAGRGIPSAIKWAGGEAPKNALAFWMVVAMGLLCALFLFLCIRSFIQARRQRQAEASTT